MNSKRGFVNTENIFTTQQKINTNFCLILLLTIAFSNRLRIKIHDIQSIAKLKVRCIYWYTIGFLIANLLLFLKIKIIPKNINYTCES